MKLKNKLFFLGLLCLLTACQSTKQQSSSTLPPDENRFTTAIISQPGDLDEPMAFSFVNKEEMLIVERKGGVKAFNVKSKEMKSVGFVPVNTKYVNKEGQSREAEEGLMGVIADPDFDTNNWIYMHYADPDEAKHVLARWDYKDGKIDDTSKKVLLAYPAQREECCHTGGGMVFDKDGNLFLTTGNNTVNPPAGTSNLDERPGFDNSDDQRTAGNTNDLRGKILRIHPVDDGTYTIPEGNLFPEGTTNTRPEIYTMGHRNPWRVSIDSKTGYIYWGEVGPDASEDKGLVPRGYDEFNQAKGPGFFGWPYFIGNNYPYVNKDGKPFDPAKPINNSPNNTGIKELPPAQGAFIWYPYAYSEDFPLLGSAGRSATGGPVFRAQDFPESNKRFPAYFEGKWLIVEFMRGWIMSVTMDEEYNLKSIEPFLPDENFSSAIDMQFSPDGDLYVLEYGSAWFRGNENAQVKRIQYNGGNRPPMLEASADKVAGAVPLNVQFSSEGTIDYDEDKLKYTWFLTSDNGFSEDLKGAKPKITLDKEGIYAVKVVVEDEEGNTDEKRFEIVAGNEPPLVDIQIKQGNQSFFFPGSNINYNISVEDKEDGSIKDGQIAEDAISINFDYVPEGFDPIEIAQNHKASDDWVVFSKGKSLIDGSDCLSCHRVDIKSIGPSYMEVAAKYKNNPKEQAVLADRIIKGSVGLWGEHAMSAHPDLSKQDAQLMVDYIMGLNDPQLAPQKLALSGSHQLRAPEKSRGLGSYLLRVAYTDKGKGNLKTLSSEKIIVLRNPNLRPDKADNTKGIHIMTSPRLLINAIEDNSYLLYKNIDLTGVSEFVIDAEASSRNKGAGAIVELHLDSPTGPLLGATEKIEIVEIDYRAELEKLKAEWEKGGKKGPEPNFRTVRTRLKPSYPIALDGKSGIHDLYFVIKNPDVLEGQILIQLNNITAKQKEDLL